MSLGNQGRDTLPVTYTTSSVTTIVQYGRRYCTEELTRTVATPSYANLDIRGPSASYLDQVNRYGLVNMKITQSPQVGRLAPSYLDVVIDGLQYKIQLNQVVNVPKIVYDVINASERGKAVLA